jgi:SAM-dependent methyltransferase
MTTRATASADRLPLGGRLRARIYDAALLRWTIPWYGAVLGRIHPEGRVLDVGIGTAGALLAQRDLLTRRRLRVVGLDIDPDYVRRARQVVAGAGLEQSIEVRLESFYDHRGGPYDAIYFSGSFMVLPDPRGALDHARTLLTPVGRLYFTQTFERRRSPLLDAIKPRLARITTIDFGRASYFDEFERTLADAGWAVEEKIRLGGKKGRGAFLILAGSNPGQVP